MAKPPFPWIGGKEKIAPYILQTFPAKLAQYVEPFGGSGAVLLALPQDQSRLDIYNDLDATLSPTRRSTIKMCRRRSRVWATAPVLRRNRPESCSPFFRSD